MHTQLQLIGQPVRSLQTMLRALSFSYNFLPRLTPDGVFGEQTLEAVMLFQREFHPPVTGRVDQDTWDAIAALYRLMLSRHTPIPSRSFPGPDFTVLPGERSVHLHVVQAMFIGLAQMLTGIQPAGASGLHDEATRQNLKWIQRLNHRPETGALDIESWNTLSRLYTVFVTNVQSPWQTRPELFS